MRRGSPRRGRPGRAQASRPSRPARRSLAASGRRPLPASCRASQRRRPDPPFRHPTTGFATVACVAGPETTNEDKDEELGEAQRTPAPGALLVFSGAPLARVLPLAGSRLALGRDALHDDRVSREHAVVEWEGGAFSVRDLGSRNGTFVG